MGAQSFRHCFNYSRSPAMYTIRCTINGSLRYYKCERIADMEALQDVLAKAGITDAIVL